ncbi:MAG TPA: lasso peptide biosynthesis B2 protein [Caulobacteraceae bacterium]
MVEAFTLLALSSAAIRVLPFTPIGRLASMRLGRPRAKLDPGVSARVAWAVRACGRRAPWRAVCFQQGLAAQIMLRRRGVDSTLYFGAAHEKTEGLTAHVWVKAGERDVVGCEEAAGFAVLATFPPRPGGSTLNVGVAERKRRFDSIQV